MPIFPETLKSIQDNTVRDLNLIPYVMTREDVETIAGFLSQGTAIQSLMFGTCQYDREVLESFASALHHNEFLMDLSMGANNEIGDNGARAFAAMLELNLTLLSLQMTKGNISDIGARALARALKVNRTLHVLDLSGNKIGDNGATALAEIFTDNKTLTRLKLDENRIGYHGISALAKALNGNQSLVEFTITNNQASDALMYGIESAFEQSKNIIMLKVSGHRISSVCSENKRIAMQLLDKISGRSGEVLSTEDIAEMRQRLHAITYIAEHDLRIPRSKILTLAAGLNQQLGRGGKAKVGGDTLG